MSWFKNCPSENLALAIQWNPNVLNVLALKKSMKSLKAKELDIIHKRYYEDKTQTEIAQELGISQAQVSRLEKNAIATLRKNIG